jgi:aspartyl/asparaginyl beta-hydroxylase (cupin superfamily)
MQLINEQFPDDEIGRIVIANLAPGEQVMPHRDQGLYSDITDRYHFVVTTNPDVVFTSGDEQEHMPRGNIYWFNNHIEHSVINQGTTNRIHLIVDLYHG